MALISTKNLVAPFTNKVNLVTIALVVILFAMFRLSGGGLNLGGSLSSGPDARGSLRQDRNPPLFEPRGNRPAPLPERGSITLRNDGSLAEEDVVSAIQADNSRDDSIETPAVRREELAPRKPKDLGSLADIERDLGLKPRGQ